MERTLNFAIVGCGVIAPAHARSIAEIPGCRLAAVCDASPAKAQALAEQFSAEAYADYAALLRRADIDVVNITTPSGTHAELGLAALRAGKHVLVEKPIDIALDRADLLIAAARQAGRQLGVVSQHRFDPAIVALKQAAQAGKLGQLNFGAAHTKWYRSQSYYDSAAWRGTWALDGGGALMNQSIHYVDLLQYLMGPVAEVSAYTANRLHARIEVEDVAVAAVRFASGALGLIEGNTAAYPGLSARLDIYGADGLVVIENDQIKEWRLRTGEVPPAEASSGAVAVATSSADIFYLGHKRQIEDMADAIRTNRPPLVDGAEGRKPLEIILAIYASARTGKPAAVGDHR
jgi:UDP-N-acetyl-2-amino-2-deoxyglucuronate dehydrogenase